MMRLDLQNIRDDVDGAYELVAVAWLASGSKINLHRDAKTEVLHAAVDRIKDQVHALDELLRRMPQ